ncbi:TlpA family protein disulfide reductase [Hanstruepera marina]|uniref:TlpA family protein disulfide reductase n=1 Tax=Hanstruepera marina TaxID=2873265 RepID=UPI001CA68FC2|nr:TlpA disulfide reductase family protein [Hanstruepera marina]
MKRPKVKTSNIIFIIVIALLIIPQTRQPIQVFIHSGLALISPSTIDNPDQKAISDYNWKLVDQDGNPFDFNNAKGQVIFVNFWATWCPPCIAEMPSIEALYKDYNDKVLFLLVSNEKPEAIVKFKEKRSFNFKFYNPISAPPSYFETRSIPKTYVIDKSGNIVMDRGGAANWNSDKVRATLDRLISE